MYPKPVPQGLINEKDCRGRTPIAHAIERNQLDAIACLERHGASIGARTQERIQELRSAQNK